MSEKLSLNRRRSFVNRLWNNGVRTVPELHKITDIPKSTLYKYIQKILTSIPLKPKPRSGRPKILSSKQRMHLGKLASSRKCASSKEIADILN
jgi:transposase